MGKATVLAAVATDYTWPCVVALKGSTPVLFRCDKSSLDAPLDLCGRQK